MASVTGTSRQHDVCAICLETPNNPTSLPTCTHLFCAACLASYVRRHESQANVACPTCTTPCPVADIKSNGLDIDSASDLIANEDASAAVTKERLCTLCSYKGIDSEGEFACIDCANMTLCNNCASLHKKKACFKCHTLKPLASKKSAFVPSAKCSKHAGWDMKFMCMDCDQLLCQICAGVEHDDHEFVDLEDIMGQVSDALDTLASTADDISSVKGEIKAVQERKAVAIVQVNARADVLEQEIRTCFTELEQQIHKRRADFIEEIQGNVACKQLDHDLSDLVTDVESSLQCGKDILARKIASPQDVKTSLGTKDQLVRKSSNATKIINNTRRMLRDAPTPIFVAGKAGPEYDLGYLESPRRGVLAEVVQPVKLQFGGRYVVNPCCEIVGAQTFVSVDHTMELAILFKHSYGKSILCKSWSKRGIRQPKLTGDLNIDGAEDMIVNNDGNIAVFRVYAGKPSIDVYSAVSHFGSCSVVQCRDDFRDGNSPSLTQTLTGNYVVIYNTERLIYVANLRGFIQRPDELPPIQIWNIPKDLSELHIRERSSHGFRSGNCSNKVRIHCVQSQDLILAHNWKGKKVLTLALKFRRVEGNIGVGDMGRIEHYFELKSPIIPPLRGYHIMDVCCDNKKAYFCIKKGTRTNETSQAGPIKMYEATFKANEWEYAAIPLVAPDGRTFDELKQDELLKLAVYSGTLMYMVYSPIPLVDLKESAEPGMNITWYYGKLPE